MEVNISPDKEFNSFKNEVNDKLEKLFNFFENKTLKSND